MKLWQLSSIVRNDRGILEQIAQGRKEWADIAKWCASFDELVRTQNRRLLDAELPPDYVSEVLASAGGVLYLSKDGWLRSWRLDSTDTPISFLESYQRYGGETLEETLERGAMAV